MVCFKQNLIWIEGSRGINPGRGEWSERGSGGKMAEGLVLALHPPQAGDETKEKRKIKYGVPGIKMQSR